ncbi:ABC-2 type transporter [Peptoanaerobacter stomatis]|uniref:Transport permease protein n=1 Tax=Peptoanaerobacter stomatis TaxID=796937 RepID=J5WQ10_9FIRM|nr:ABC transporter permease [Peptoanaerobacter stomatis]EJU23557.1 ABC-2 type transporter [Peptoanaerobacter stomatis]
MLKSKKKILVLILFIALSNILIVNKAQLKVPSNINLEITVKSENYDVYQVFYSHSLNFSEEYSGKLEYENKKYLGNLQFAIPVNTKFIRMDLGINKGNILITSIKFKNLFKKYNLPLKDLKIIESNNIRNISYSYGSLSLESLGQDSSIVCDVEKYVKGVSDNYKINLIIKIISCILVDIMLIIFIKKSRSVLQLSVELNNNKTLIWNLAKNDFKTKYAGSYLGIIWAFINPIITILIYWFVFQYGLKAGSPIKDTSFIFWFMSGLIPWFFFQEALINATNCMLEYSYLVKKVVFKISILPIIKIISAVFVHLVFIVFLLTVGCIQGKYPDIMIMQLIYYSFCAFFLVLGLSYATASIILFFRDLSQIIGIFLQIGMWMTPIMWSYTIIPEKLQWIAKLNPMYYVVEGYRDTLINKVWFWDRYFQTVYFWILAIGIFVIGSIIFKKLKPHFSDVL